MLEISLLKSMIYTTSDPRNLQTMSQPKKRLFSNFYLLTFSFLFYVFFTAQKNSLETEISLFKKKKLLFLERKVKEEYGALWTNRDPEVKLPPEFVFLSAKELKKYQQKLDLAVYPGYQDCLLQRAALEKLLLARAEARKLELEISPRGKDSCLRSFERTSQLWSSRVEPNLRFYLQEKKISPEEAELIKTAKIHEQVKLILDLEKKRNLLFDKYRKTSILRSVAAPGTSQHLSGLAFDLKEYANPRTRKIMQKFGWYQTVIDDLPHFTYLGFNPEQDSLRNSVQKLKKVSRGKFEYWILSP